LFSVIGQKYLQKEEELKKERKLYFRKMGMAHVFISFYSSP
jgi:hypothetical protein